MDLSRLERNCRSFNAWDILVSILNKHLKDIEALNKEQLQRGDTAEDGVGTPKHRRTPKSEIYVDSKIERGVYNESIYPHMNFYNYGDFYKGIKAKLTLFDIEIESLDSKSDLIEKKYGSNLIGLNSDSIKKLIDNIIDEYRKEVLKHITG